jgi:hypothetical protein
MVLMKMLRDKKKRLSAGFKKKPHTYVGVSSLSALIKV